MMLKGNNKMMFSKTFFSARLKELRGACSQAEMARNVGVTQQGWARYESGKVTPGAEVLHQICVACSVSADWLLGLTDSKQPGVTAVKSSVAIGAGAVAGAVAGNCASCPLMLAASKVVSGKRK